MRCQAVTHAPAHVLVTGCPLMPQTSVPSFDGFLYGLQFGALHVGLTKLPGFISPEPIVRDVPVFLSAGCALAIRLAACNVLDVNRAG